MAEDPSLTPRRGHEPDRPNARSLILFGIALFAVLGVSLFLIGLGFRLFSEKVARSEPPPPPLVGSQIPPAPRLQVNPELDLGKMHQEEDQHLDTYRWVDRQAGTITVPVDQAIDYVAQHGLPTFPAPASSTARQSGAEAPRGVNPTPRPAPPAPAQKGRQKR